MKKLIILLTTLVLLSSCNMSRWCAKHNPPQISTYDSISTHTNTNYRDTTAHVIIPNIINNNQVNVTLSDSVKTLKELIHYLQLQLVLHPNATTNDIIKTIGLNTEMSHLKTPFAESWAQVVNGKLNHKLEQGGDSLIILKNAIKEKTTEIYRLKQSNTVTQVHYLTKMDNFFVVCGYILCSIVGLFVLWIILKFLIKVNIPFLKI